MWGSQQDFAAPLTGQRETNDLQDRLIYESESRLFLSPINLLLIVGLFLVSFFTVTSCALSLASRKFQSAPIRASFVFCR